MIRSSKHIVFLGGAGVSTESGIPDFRSKDGLHQKAGSKNVKEIHGSALRSYCVSCRKEYGQDYIFENQEEIPHCPKCGKMVRPDVTLYGELLPEPAYEEAVAVITTLQGKDSYLALHICSVTSDSGGCDHGLDPGRNDFAGSMVRLVLAEAVI